MQDRIQPQDLEAERSILGAMMISKDAIALAAGRVKPDHFYRQAHSDIFKAILTLYQRNEPVDLITVSGALKKQDVLEKIGGHSFLADIINSVPTASNVDSYSRIVIEKYMLRRLIDISSDVIKESFDDTSEGDAVLEDAQKRLMDLSSEQGGDEFVKLDTVLKGVFDDIQSVYDTEDKILGVTSGFKDLDAVTSGFQKADLCILAARPSMGKTALALNFAVNAALKNIPVAIFSLEMPADQLAVRLLSSESKLDMKRLRTASLHEHEYKNLINALGTLSEAPIYIDDSPGISPLELRAKTRRIQAEADIKLIIIDYLQLMKGGKRRAESRYHEVSEIVREVKAFAKESGIPIIALSQLSRSVEQRQDKTPMLSDLRETGEIEQTADLVMFIHREDYYEQKTSDSMKDLSLSPTNVVIAKHRNGPTGAVQLMFKKNISKFQDAEQVHVVPQ